MSRPLKLWWHAPPRRAAGAVTTVSLLTLLTMTVPARVEATTEHAAGLTIIDQTFTMRPGADLILVLEVGDQAPAGTSVEFEVAVHDVLTDTSQFADLDAGSVPAVHDVVTVPADLAATPDDRVTITVPIGEVGATAMDSLDPGAPGIHALSVTMTQGTVRGPPAVTYVESGDPDVAGSVVAFAVLAGIADPGPLPTVDERTTGVEQLQALMSLSEAVDGPLTLWLPPSLVAPESPAVDPTVPADAPSTDVTSTDVAPDTGSTPVDSTEATAVSGDIDLATRLATAFVGDEVVARPAVDLDPSALVAVDRVALFTNDLRRGEDLVAAGSPEPVVSRAAWVTDRPLSRGAAVVLRNVGFRTVVLSDDATDVLSPVPTDAVFDLDLDGNGDLAAIRVSPLGSQLDPLDTSPDDAGRAASPVVRAARLAAELVVDQAVIGTPVHVLAATGIGVPDPDVTASLARFASASDVLEMEPLSDLGGLIDRAASASQVVGLPSDAGADLSLRLVDIDAVRDDATDAASMLVDPSPVNPWTDDLDRLLAADLTDAQVRTGLSAVAVQTARVLDAVVPPDSTTFTLTGSSGTLRLRVENTGDIPLQVRVRARSLKLRFPTPAEPRVVPAQSAEEFDIPVIARSNGTFTVEVDLLTPDGSRTLAPPVILKARVTRLTGLSRVVSAGAVLVLVSWWFSHLRRDRRRRALVAGATVAPGPLDALSPDAAEARD